jgi:hypothetical protein
MESAQEVGVAFSDSLEVLKKLPDKQVLATLSVRDKKYVAKVRGLYRDKKKISAGIVPIGVANHPRTSRSGRVFAVHSVSGEWRIAWVPEGELNTDKALRRLSDEGFPLPETSLKCLALRKFLVGCDKLPPVRLGTHTGWHVDMSSDGLGTSVFVLGNSVIGPPSRLYAQNDRAGAPLFVRRGSNKIWKEDLELQKSSRLMSALNWTLAVPLAHLLDFPISDISFIGNATGKSRSAALNLLAAVYGEPTAFLENSSKIARREQATIYHHLPLIFGTQVANQPTKGGPLIRNPVLSVHAAIVPPNGRGKRHGRPTSVIHIPMDPARGLFDAGEESPEMEGWNERTNGLARKNYGVLGYRFLLRLSKEIEMVRSEAPERLSNLTENLAGSLPIDTTHDGAESAIIEQLAFIALAGELASKWQVISWSGDDCRKAALACLMFWAARHKTELSEAHETSVQVVKKKLSELGPLTDLSQFEPNGPIAYMHEYQDKPAIVILQRRFREEFLQGLDAQRIVTDLFAAGLLPAKRDGHTVQFRARFKGESVTPIPNFYVLDPRVLE